MKCTILPVSQEVGKASRFFKVEVLKHHEVLKFFHLSLVLTSLLCWLYTYGHTISEVVLATYADITSPEERKRSILS